MPRPTRCRLAGWQAVGTSPGRTEVSDVDRIREELLLIIKRGATELTATVSRDHAGVDAVVRACQRAVASGTQLRLMITNPSVRRVLILSGLDRLIPI
jgi:anti-anti-sigma regulatory factor